MIDCILFTDIEKSFIHASNLKTKIATYDIHDGINLDKMIFDNNKKNTYDNQQLILGMCVHTSDISNPAKPAVVNQLWVDLVFIEFFNQGDIEKNQGLPISPLCDRNNTDVNKSQVNFINFIVLPTFETLRNVIPELISYVDVIKSNLKRYENLTKESEKFKDKKI